MLGRVTEDEKSSTPPMLCACYGNRAGDGFGEVGEEEEEEEEEGRGCGTSMTLRGTPRQFLQCNERRLQRQR